MDAFTTTGVSLLPYSSLKTVANNHTRGKTISETPEASFLPHSSLGFDHCDVCMFQHSSLNIFTGLKKTTKGTIHRLWKDKPISGLHGRNNGLSCGPGQCTLLCFSYCHWLGSLVHKSGGEARIIIHCPLLSTYRFLINHEIFQSRFFFSPFDTERSMSCLKCFLILNVGCHQVIEELECQVNFILQTMEKPLQSLKLRADMMVAALWED